MILEVWSASLTEAIKLLGGGNGSPDQVGEYSWEDSEYESGTKSEVDIDFQRVAVMVDGAERGLVAAHLTSTLNHASERLRAFISLTSLVCEILQESTSPMRCALEIQESLLPQLRDDEQGAGGACCCPMPRVLAVLQTAKQGESVPLNPGVTATVESKVVLGASFELKRSLKRDECLPIAPPILQANSKLLPMDGQHLHNLAHLRLTNDPPHHTEATHIHEQIASLTTAIEQAQLHLQQLERQRQEWQVLVSPLRRMPLEVLGRIFGACILGTSIQSIPRVVVNLCLVCQTWREAALLRHNLWSRIKIRVFPDGHPRRLEYEVIRRWLIRSGSVPKTIIAHGVHEYSAQECPMGGCYLANPTLVNLLRAGPLTYLDHLSLLIQEVSCLRQLIRAVGAASAGLPRAWGSLTSLKLSFFGLYENKPQDDPDNVFHHLPQVTSFEFALPRWDENWMDDLELQIPDAFLGRLQNLHLKCDWGGNHIPNILRRCENLEVLTLNLRGSTSQQQANVQPISYPLPKLHTLRLRQFHPNRGHLLDLLEMPILGQLDISFEPARIDHGLGLTWKKTVPLSFILSFNKHPDLRLLRLHAAIIPDIPVAFSYFAFPKLKHLVLDEVDFSTAWFASSFPHIETLELLRLSPHYELADIFRNAVCLLGFGYHTIGSSAHANGHRSFLKKLRATWENPAVLPEDLEAAKGGPWLERLREERGVEVSLGRSDGVNTVGNKLEDSDD
ncbi:hypothetical protein DFP72DRAFT_841306 [Ephemerocybe angulata]|uniref:F-box domain-containing protein n=1 Tax=Ephemerocybe angulata TaxID=980116 RepID=A0A8H6MFE3_9AGAR|nr:hypothetical protein DFP72DRAFT_841306 [Tulosesus angulatus]